MQKRRIEYVQGVDWLLLLLLLQYSMGRGSRLGLETGVDGSAWKTKRWKKL